MKMSNVEVFQFQNIEVMDKTNFRACSSDLRICLQLHWNSNELNLLYCEISIFLSKVTTTDSF